MLNCRLSFCLMNGFKLHFSLWMHFSTMGFKIAGGWSVLQMSPSNEDASVAQWYGLGTLNPRTCFLFLRHGEGLSQEPYHRYHLHFYAFFTSFSTGTIARLPLHCFISTGTIARQFNRNIRPIVTAWSSAAHRSTFPVYSIDRLLLFIPSIEDYCTVFAIWFLTLLLVYLFSASVGTELSELEVR